MTKETKQQIFEDVLTSYLYAADALIDESATDSSSERLKLGNLIASTRARYDAASLCRLPVIPKYVGDFIRSAKLINMSLFDAMQYIQSPFNQFYEWAYGANLDTFAIAWLLEDWDQEERLCPDL